MSTVEPVIVLSSVLGVILELQVVCPLSVRLVQSSCVLVYEWYMDIPVLVDWKQ